MTLRLIIGIDPGVNGAIALLADGRPSTVYDMPKRDRSSGGSEIDACALVKLIDGIAVAYIGTHVHAVLEPPSTRPGESPTNALKMGEGYGVLKGVLASHGIDWTETRPQTWKAWQGLANDKRNGIVRTKDDSRRVALSKWPTFGIHFQRVCDHDRAEAMLMAEWGNETECWIAKPVRAKVRKPSKRKSSHTKELAL